jgi:predicted transposase YbfD/YdcC
MVTKLSLVECMSVVEDPRLDRMKAHRLLDIFVLTVLAVLCGAEGCEDIELLRKIRPSWLRKFIKLEHGVPSHDTISRVFRMIQLDAFPEAFLECVKSLDLKGEAVNAIAIDGRSLCRSHDKRTFNNMLHRVAAWSVANDVVLGCQLFDEKSNEMQQSVSFKRFAEVVRAHSGIENSFHWVIDIPFNGDQSRISATTVLTILHCCGDSQSTSSTSTIPRKSLARHERERLGTKTIYQTATA